ncbi:plant UBX domain-containing protein 8-like [Phragmites australis]|uniref:plant UBX domain-containing protein 8-like n=1 Tax=Phragmites australis TaxID=29695 RepID=UPI002D78AFB1|nr:plant UBX domain-containing protein 8-like [Phragmites australis]
MARPPQEAIDTFVSITGADEAVAVRKLEEHGGDLNQAINSHFNEGDNTLNRINQNALPASCDDMVDLDGPLDNTFQRSFPETSWNPFALMDPNFQQQFLDRIGSTDSFSRGPLVSHPREVREIPIEVNDSNPQTGLSGQALVIEDVTGHESSHGPEVHETIIIDDEDDGLSSAPSAPHSNIPTNTSRLNPSVSTAPPLVHVNDYDDDIEEEMIRAVIEASKKDAEGLENIVEQGSDQHPEGVNLGDHSSDESDMGAVDGTVGRQGLASGKAGTSRQPIDEESFQEETEDVEEQPLVRRRSRRAPSGNTELAQPVDPGASATLNVQPQSNLNDRQYNGDDFPSEWGGISSEEHDEAVMLEAAMFGGVPEGPTYPFSMPSHRSSTHYPPVHSPSPALTEQRLLREQQDDEYLASLQADQEKELKAFQEAELRRLEETAAREATLEKQKQEEEERCKKQREEEELESNLASKQASLPLEPPPDNEGAVTLVVRMPDGSRQGRRFLKSDKLQFLFDFLDIGRTCKPGTYRLVRSYPRRTFTNSEGDVSFSDLGLTSKQEVLFLEQITG